MAVYKIKKGLDIPINGIPKRETITVNPSALISARPTDFLGYRPKALVQEGDRVKRGQHLFFLKKFEEIKFRSPGGGVVKEIRLGPRRVVTDIVIELDSGEEEEETFDKWEESKLKNTEREHIIDHMLNGGIWPYLRQRPFGKIARPENVPQAIFINAMNTEPLTMDQSLYLGDRYEDFLWGVNVLRTLTEGKLYLILDGNRPEDFNALSKTPDIDIHHFKGPHPAGLTGVHIRLLEPVKPGKTIWYLKAADLVSVGSFFRTGRYPVERMISVGGPRIKNPVHCMTRLGVSFESLLADNIDAGSSRIVSGSILSGRAAEMNDFVGFYDWSCTVLPETDKREFMGWGMPGFHRYSALPLFASALMPWKKYDLDTRKHGGVRAIVNIGAWEEVFPFDIHLSYLLRAILAEDIEEAESLGLLELTEEDVALCTFIDPCKIEIGKIIRQGLDQYENEL